jgi:hypothetical protein
MDARDADDGKESDFWETKADPAAIVSGDVGRGKEDKACIAKIANSSGRVYDSDLSTTGGTIKQLVEPTR